MKIRDKKRNEIGHSQELDIHPLGEILVYFYVSIGANFIKDYEVYLESKDEWFDLLDALKNDDVVVDNYNRIFREAKTDDEKLIGCFFKEE